MTAPYESARLILELYELRRDPTMREARHWYTRSFHPRNVDDVLQTYTGPDSAYFRMVTSYWDMAASFVVHGAIDEAMFNDANGEHTIAFAKLEPFLAELRERRKQPGYLKHLETLIMNRPNAKEELAGIRERFKPAVT